MKIGGKKSANDLQLRHWQRLVPDTETSRKSFQILLLDLCTGVERALDVKAVNLQAHEVGKKINDVLRRHIDRLKTLFETK